MEKKFTIKVKGTPFDIDLNGAPEAMLSAILRQGAAILIQRSTAGMADKTDRQRLEAMEKVAKALNDHSWKPGTSGEGRERLDDVTKEFRAIFEGVLKQSGVKSADAAKYAREEGQFDHYRDLVIKPALIKLGDTERLAELDTIAKRNFDKLWDKAKANVAARATESVDLDI